MKNKILFNQTAYPFYREACHWRLAWKLATIYNADKNLLSYFRQLMRNSALIAVTEAKK